MPVWTFNNIVALPSLSSTHKVIFFLGRKIYFGIWGISHTFWESANQEMIEHIGYLWLYTPTNVTFSQGCTSTKWLCDPPRNMLSPHILISPNSPNSQVHIQVENYSRGWMNVFSARMLGIRGQFLISTKFQYRGDYNIAILIICDNLEHLTP